MTDNEKSLIAALEALLYMKVKGHDLIDRMQFSKEGRDISQQCLDAINSTKNKEAQL